MPSKKRRMMLSLPDELSSALDTFREVSGMAASSFVVEILIEALPMIVASTEALKLAKQGNSKSLEVLSGLLAGALHTGSGIQVELIEQTTALRKARTDNPAKGVKRPRKVNNA